MNPRRATLDEIRERMARIYQERSKRNHMITHTGKQELAWVVYEREQIHKIVNDMRQAQGKERLPIEEIERIERLAVGHVDYASKIALYAMELVHDQP
jgi:hypothetical protein